MARPKETILSTKDKRVTVRLSEAMYDVLEYEAKHCHLSKAEFIRRLILGKKLKPIPIIIHDERYIVQELRNIDKLEKDLDLIARYLKEGGEFTKPILDKIEKVHYDLDIAIHDFNRAVENEYEMV